MSQLLLACEAECKVSWADGCCHACPDASHYLTRESQLAKSRVCCQQNVSSCHNGNLGKQLH